VRYKSTFTLLYFGQVHAVTDKVWKCIDRSEGKADTDIDTHLPSQ